MPLYEYECLKCGERFELIQKFSDAPLTVCSQNGGSQCDGAVRKLLSAPAIQFKGSGWYVTDYGKGGKKPEQARDEGSPKKDAKSDESKPAKSSESSTSSASAASVKPKGGESASAAA
ncbi:MAG: zinc ribbon domain-containing protein [Bryobacterales bacterium]|nr:zinc ribbon domain-containing protein [Bryobacterales bacterium]